MLLSKFEIDSFYTPELKNFLVNCNLLIEFINNLPKYDFNRLVADYVLLNRTGGPAMETLFAGMDAVKEQHDAKLRQLIHDQLKIHFSDNNHLELLTLSVNKFSEKLNDDVDSLQPSMQVATHDYSPFDEFKNCGPFSVLKANKLAMAAMMIDALLTQLEKQQTLLGSKFNDFKTPIITAKNQIIACMRLHLKVNGINYQSNTTAQRDVVSANALNFSFIEINAADEAGESKHTRTTITNPFEMSIQVLDGSGIGKPIPSDLIDYFHRQYTQFTSSPIGKFKLNPDRTLGERIEDPLAMEVVSEADQVFTVTFFKNYLEQQNKINKTVSPNQGYFQLVCDMGAWLYKKYYGKDAEISINRLDEIPEIPERPIETPTSNVSQFFKETDRLIQSTQKKEEGCCLWKPCTLL
jgi:hypothetical protein